MRLTRRGRAALILGILVALVVVPFLGLNIYLRSVGVWGSSDPGKEVSIKIPKGTNPQAMGKLLADAGVIESTTGWRIALFLGSGEEEIQAGSYRLPVGLTAPDALDRLIAADPEGPQFVTVTFPEGSWLEDFAAILDRETHISGDAFMKVLDERKVTSSLVPDDAATLEGALFPSTYQILETDSAKTVAQRLIGEMEKQMEAIDLSKADSLNLTPYDILIVASMIEAETRVDDERPMVARVIYNRLQQGITLGIDATVIYALGEHTDSLTVSQLEIDSPFNTRKFQGLPPTPIGAPGAESLAAAANPADGSWVYYVLADCEGNHAFSESYDEFLQNKANQPDCS